jgi:hypothetical protein
VIALLARAAHTPHDCVTSNPGFTDPARYDYSLKATSPIAGAFGD